MLYKSYLYKKTHINLCEKRGKNGPPKIERTKKTVHRNVETISDKRN